MTLRRSLPLVVLGAALVAAAVPFVVGGAEGRLASAFVLAGVLVPLAAGVRTQRADDDRLSLLDAASAHLRGPGSWLLGLAVGMAVLLFAVMARPDDGDVTWSGWLAAGVIAAAVAIGMAATVRWVRSREGVERRELTEATSIAFFVTVLAAATYATFESIADAPRLSMWVVWGVGMGTWSVVSVVRGIRDHSA
ncbi:MAG TPA: hypothetical protein VEA78_07375 [Acidimicrobiales bacterium]|nr:hypothetical protein [Acidimicrobiales bacterium]